MLFKKINASKILFLLLIIEISYADCFAGVSKSMAEKYETKGSVNIPEGMTTIKIGDSYVVLPKGGIVRQKGNMYFIESPDEYAARKFKKVEKRIGHIESELRLLKKEIRNKKADKV